MADYTTGSPATLVCATQFTEIMATITGTRQANGETFIDVTYVGLDHSTCSTTLRIPDNATDAEIDVAIKAYGVQWYTAARWRIVNAGSWYSALSARINEELNIPVPYPD